MWADNFAIFYQKIITLSNLKETKSIFPMVLQ